MNKIRKRSWLPAGALILMSMVLLFGGWGCRQKLTPSKKSETGKKGARYYPTTKPSAIAGQSIYKDNCENCHGETGAGDGKAASSLTEKPKDFTNLKFMRREEPQEFFEAITKGKEAMPKYNKKLTKQQRWDVLFYVWSFGTSPQRIEEGKEAYKENCDTCHGEKGDAKGEATSGLKKKPHRFDDPKLMMKENGNEFFEAITKGDKPMPAFKKDMSEDERWNTVDYLWSFVYEPPKE